MEGGREGGKVGRRAVHPDQAVAKIGVSGLGVVIVRGVVRVITFHRQVPAMIDGVFPGFPFSLALEEIRRRVSCCIRGSHDFQVRLLRSIPLLTEQRYR